MSWFQRQKPSLDKGASDEGERHVRTEGLWLKCESCRQVIWRKALDENFQVCPKCDFHFKLDAVSRLRLLFDGDYVEQDRDLRSNDPLGFVDSKPYLERLESMRAATALEDAVISATGELEGRVVNVCA
jgi:acetyl-CoA carboxylase carboxyl transferase subunit beta